MSIQHVMSSKKTELDYYLEDVIGDESEMKAEVTRFRERIDVFRNYIEDDLYRLGKIETAKALLCQGYAIVELKDEDFIYHRNKLSFTIDKSCVDESCTTKIGKILHGSRVFDADGNYVDKKWILLRCFDTFYSKLLYSPIKNSHTIVFLTSEGDTTADAV